MCTLCDLCRKNCRFHAIQVETNYTVDGYACEGCGVCEAICPAEAVILRPAISGELMLYKSKSIFSTAQLKMGSGTSGRLVTEVKKQLKSASYETEFSIIDGSPGIGCPVIASISGVDMALIVTEPSLSGISDLERIIRTAERFQPIICVCINKYDINMENTEKIESLCQKLKVPVVGRIPFDSEVVTAINTGRSIVNIECPAGRATKKVFDETIKYLFSENIK